MNKHIFFIVWLLFISGCSEDYLDKPPQNLLTQENFPETAADALSATNAVYQTLRLGTYHRGFYPIDDVMSDDAHKGSNVSDQINTLGQFEGFEHTTTNDLVFNWWSALYVGIRRANVVVNRVPDVPMDEELKNRYLAEARFLRGLFYSDLARGYGGVVLVTDGNPNVPQTRSTLEETYTFIESDLRFALDNLPEKSDYSNDDLGRATKGAARALLSRVYLYQNEFDSALFFANEVINSGQYQLEPEFSNAFAEAFEHGVESVFEVGGLAAFNPEGGSNEYSVGQGVRGVPNRGFGFNRPSLDLINSFEADDPRMDATVIFLGEVIDGIEILGDPGTPDETTDDQGNVVEIETYNQKIWTAGTTVESNRSHNRRLIRYAEVLLNAAEAEVELNNVPRALELLEEVRERARGGNDAILPEITETDPGALMDLIFEERRHELAMEGFRFWDLVRSGRAVDVLGPLGYIEGLHELLPIPQSERDISQGAIEQNPGWN